jgi:hypothetical protein
MEDKPGRKEARMYWVARRSSITAVISLALSALGLQRIVFGLDRHAPIVVTIGVALLAAAGVLIRRACRIPTRVGDQEVSA